MEMIVLYGINEYGKNCMFGIAILKENQGTDISWMLQRVKQISEKEPQSIFTEFNSNYEEEIKVIFPKSKHLYSPYSICKVIEERLENENEMKLNLKQDLINLPYKSSTDEFEHFYQILKGSLNRVANEEFFKNLHSKRDFWACAFETQFFNAGFSRYENNISNGLWEEVSRRNFSVTSFYTAIQEFEDLDSYNVPRIYQPKDKANSRTEQNLGLGLTEIGQ